MDREREKPLLEVGRDGFDRRPPPLVLRSALGWPPAGELAEKGEVGGSVPFADACTGKWTVSISSDELGPLDPLMHCQRKT